MKTHRIAHIVESLNRDGTSNVLKSIIGRRRPDEEHHVIVLTDNYDADFIQDWREMCTLYPLSLKLDQHYRLRDYFRHWINSRLPGTSAPKKFTETIREIDPTIVHFHTHPRELLWGRSIPKKKIYTDHLVRLEEGLYPSFNLKWLGWLYRRFYKSYDIVAVSKSVTDCHQKYKLVAASRKHTCIENGIDTDRFHPPRDGKTDDCIYVSRFSNVKGHEVLIRAWSALPAYQHIALNLAGDGELRSEMEELARESESRNPINFTGLVSNIDERLRQCSIGAFPSFREGLPLALLEMMSTGLAVVASDIPELASVITHGKNGMLFPVGDVESLTAILEELITNKDLRCEIGDNARTHVVENYSIDRMVREYQELYDQV